MAEDIDDLLDEVESKFCLDKQEEKSKSRGSKVTNRHGDKSERKSSKTAKHGCSVSGPEAKAVKDDLSQAIDDIFEEDQFILQPPVKSQLQQKKNTTEAIKCFPVYMGGSKYLQGLATTVSERACDKLHCISCDNKVISFDNFGWSDSSSSYLFFRNNYPDFARLKQALVPKSGSRAYACQCSWKSVRGLEETKHHPSLKWVCSKH